MPPKQKKDQYISLLEAVSMVQSHNTIGVGIAGAEPVGLLSTFAERAKEVHDVHFWTCLPMRSYDIFTKSDMNGHVFNENWFYSFADRQYHQEGRVSYIPNNLHQAATDKLSATQGHLDIFGAQPHHPTKMVICPSRWD
jgi:acyl-CoA hydrolase